MDSPSENIFWTFSSAAQTIAAFVGFLLAGYALVYTMMESAAQADETLQEIHDALKLRYHRYLSWLVSFTAAAIFASLSTVYLNGSSSIWYSLLLIAAGLFNAVAIVGGVGFVITIVDPAKYRKAARKLAQEVRPESHEVPGGSPSEFFEHFIEVERILRTLWEDLGRQLVATSSRPGPPTLRRILEELLMAEVVPRSLYDRLMRVNRYRNLVFHGHVQEVDPEVLEEVRRVRSELEDIRGRYNGDLPT
jgi:hypothetical protein